MDFHELYSFAEGTNSIDIKNCHVSLTIQNNNGVPTLHVDFSAYNFESYDLIQQFMVNRGIDFLEHDIQDPGMTCTHFEVHTQLTLMLSHKIARMNLGGRNQQKDE